MEISNETRFLHFSKAVDTKFGGLEEAKHRISTKGQHS